MNETTFNDLVDETFTRIEDAIDDAGVDIDYENSGGILTLSCADGSAIILTRQVATSELWLAARSGGFHFHYDEAGQQWCSTREGDTLVARFAAVTAEQAGTAVALD